MSIPTVCLALKPKYATRKAYDKVIFKEEDMLTIIDVMTPRQILPLLDTCLVAIVGTDKKYYPIDEETYVEQYSLAKEGDLPTVEADDKFGIKKLNSFVSYPALETEHADQIQDSDFNPTNGIFRGTCLKVITPIDDTINKAGYWFVFNFDMASATEEGYSEIKLVTNDGEVEIADGANYVYAGATESDVPKMFILVKATLTIPAENEESENTVVEINESFENRLSGKVMIPGDDVPALEVNGKACDGWVAALTLINATGGTIKVNKSVDAENKDLFELTGGKQYNIVLMNGAVVNTGRINLKYGTMIIGGNGTIETDTDLTSPIVCFNEDRTKFVDLTVEKDVTLKGWAGFFVSKNAVNTTVNIAGHLIGQGKDENDGVGLYINGTAIDCDVTFTGTIDGEQINGMYLAGNANTVIEGATINSTSSGIEIRAGSLRIDNSYVKTTYEGEPTVTANGNGSTTVGAAIAVAQHSTAIPISVIVNNTTCIGPACILESNPQNNPNATETTSIVFNPSSCVGKVMTNDPDNDCKHFVTGGRYKDKPDDMYIAEGYEVKETYNGRYEVVKTIA